MARIFGRRRPDPTKLDTIARILKPAHFAAGEDITLVMEVEGEDGG